MHIDLNDPLTIQEEMLHALQEYDVAQTSQAIAFKRQAVARLEKEKYRAKAWLVSKEQDTDNGRPPSNDWVDNEIQDDPEYHELQAEFIEERGEYEKYLAKAEILKVKLDVLRTIAATVRVEMSHQLNNS